MSAGQDTEGDTPVTDTDRSSIGARLAAARKASSLDIRTIASELHVDTATIEALENDDTAALPAAIFVKGYLRNYARMVGLPAEELVRDFTAQTGEPPPLTVVAIKGDTPFFQLPSARLVRNIILLLLAGILLWLAYPFVERLIETRGQSLEQTESDRLALPPAKTE